MTWRAALLGVSLVLFAVLLIPVAEPVIALELEAVQRELEDIAANLD